MTRRFNLQPWRAELREAQRKQFINLTAIIAGAAVLLCALYWYMEQKYLDGQQEAISYYRAETDKFKKAKEEVEKVKKFNTEITRQINTIQGLQTDRDLTLRVFDYIAKNTPETVFLNSLSYNQKKLTINGTAENEMGVSSFVRILQNFTVDVKGKPVKPLKLNIQPTMLTATSTNRFTVADQTPVRNFTLVVDVSPISRELSGK